MIAETVENVTGEFISRPAAAKLLGGSARLVDSLISSGDLPGYRIGGRIKLRAGDVTGYINRSRIAVTQRIEETT